MEQLKMLPKGHCQIRQYLTDMLTQQRKKLSSLGSCSLINCPKHAINNSVKPKRNSNHLTSNNLSIDGFQYPNKKLTAKTSYNANGNDNNLKLKNKFQNLSNVNDVDENSDINVTTIKMPPIMVKSMENLTLTLKKI
ncbi:hypothetical protein CEXT_410121 [Caerostris extrusa]|uniref:Uncharacterized protein n=1 Tax=Caerostris extrusa TaxID=172846 RepID=A0AAV4UUC4_CAEEX|nr:hypothetical protein CEXT_410121 [Caerostris extrusa]